MDLKSFKISTSGSISSSESECDLVNRLLAALEESSVSLIGGFGACFFLFFSLFSLNFQNALSLFFSWLLLLLWLKLPSSPPFSTLVLLLYLYNRICLIQSISSSCFYLSASISACSLLILSICWYLYSSSMRSSISMSNLNIRGSRFLRPARSFWDITPPEAALVASLRACSVAAEQDIKYNYTHT
ncbi:hypothetical protein FGO68_gene14337 [Halteria grandinella]|uniref:Uncharacterized protein n=1 Tax=Halteria grandinella TaxID=5974 RepID=A0A8J8T5U7_HALGN|nr:hypothetical protein FGO68_gene14337 [Halteria grandinella]